MTFGWISVANRVVTVRQTDLALHPRVYFVCFHILVAVNDRDVRILLILAEYYTHD